MATIRFLPCVVLLVTFLGREALAAEPNSGTFPARMLRGYGEVSAEVTAAGPKASLLTIHCADEDKARILEAKYLSDLGLLPGVRTQAVPTSRGALAARVVDGQGLIAAVRADETIFILAAQDNAGLAALCENAIPAAKQLDFTDETEKDAGVPMYLDRWDRYGMRFYYYPLGAPEDLSAAPTGGPHSPQADLDFALNAGNCGLLPWEAPFPTEQAEGILKTPLWSFIVPSLQKTGTPFGVNLSMAPCGSLFNRWREEWTMREPQYLGGFYGLLDTDEGIFSWDSVAGRDAELAVLQQTVRRYNDTDNVANWLNPDGEMGHGAPDNLINYGPVADAGYRAFLKEKYKDIQTVSQRWTGDERKLTNWKQVRVPELASFLGWGKGTDAIDLMGTWKIGREAAIGAETAAAGFDDSSWPSMTAPGDAIGILTAHRDKSAVFRRHITIDARWRSAHPHAWLYVFDLSDTRELARQNKPGTQAFLNGTLLSESEPEKRGTEAHWGAYDISSALKVGDNLIAIDVPQGFFNYRVYLSPVEPHSYPDLGPQLNAQWADFIDWGSWSRGDAVRRGTQMIRQVDANRPVTFMAPDSYADVIKDVAEDYGGVFHNTGYMAGVWADFQCMQMASADLPSDCEPGSGAKDLQEFKGFLGRWSTEGIQGVDYFQNISEVEFRDQIRNYFLQTLNLWHLIGKYHTPKAQLALFSSDRTDRLFGFPFDRNLKSVGRHGHWEVRLNELLMPDFPRDELFPHDFARGYADAYKVIVDSNTSVMEPELVNQIGKWVKAGGIFITWGDTGRSTSTQKDAWPISVLTGYRATEDSKPRHLFPAEHQQLILQDATWKNARGTGQTLEKQSPDCQELLTWDDGSTAAGMKQLGKGYVVTLGTQLENTAAKHFLGDVCDWAKIARIPATAPDVLMRHFVSNNGLYDVWAMYNTKQQPVKTTLTIRNELALKSAIDVQTGKPIPLAAGADGGVAMPVSLDNWQTQVVLTPRNSIVTAPVDWFALQRNWWRDGGGKMGAPMAVYQSKFTVDLQQDWAFRNLGSDATQGPALADPKLDDSAWTKQPLGIFNFAAHEGEMHGMFRKTFTVPANWNAGPVTLWLTEWHGVGYIDKGQAYLDGKSISGSRAILGDALGGALQPGTTHTLAVEAWGTSPVVGTPASVWINYRPDAKQHQDLAGEWEPAVDGLTYTAPVIVPGTYKGIALRRMVKITPGHEKDTAVLRIGADDPEIYGVIVNGTWISRFHHHIGNNFDLAITPYLKFDGENQIVLYGGASHSLTNVSLEFYPKGTYP